MNDDRVRSDDEKKMHFLFKALEGGEAIKVVENLRDVSFEVAWRLLTNTYDDPFRHGKAHYDGIFKSRERGIKLRQRLISYRQHTAGLKAAYEELNLNPFEQVVINSFLDHPDTRPPLRLAWERKVTEHPGRCSLEHFFRFIENESTSNERAFDPPTSMTQPSCKKGKALVQVTKGSNVKKGYCYKCKSQVHYLSQCQDFQAMPVADRWEVVKQNNLCFVCLKKRAVCQGARKGAAQCQLKRLFCKECKRPHNTLLHSGKIFISNLILNPVKVDVPSIGGSAKPMLVKSIKWKSRVLSQPLTECSTPTAASSNGESSRLVPPSQSTVSICLFSEQISHTFTSREMKDALLTTSLVKLKSCGHEIEARALLDNGSQFNFVSMRIVTLLRAEIFETRCAVSGIGNHTTSITKSVNIKLRSCYTNTEQTISCLVVDSIVNGMIPDKNINIEHWNIPQYVHLADPYFHILDTVDILLGLEVFWKVLGIRKIKLNPELPYLQETELGWILAGSIQTNREKSGQFGVYFAREEKDDLIEALEKFWTIEHCTNIIKSLTPEEAECESLFEKTTYRQQDGRFVVTLPLKQDPSVLGESRSEALKFFIHLEKRLQRDAEVYQNYVQCMNEYISLGHMKEIDDTIVPNKPVYYIPHHMVFNLTSSSTKQRTVFNASNKTKSGLSLNDIQCRGPVVQPELYAILLRFRAKKYVMSADIVKMYRQILIKPDQYSLQRVFWRNSVDEKLKTYELCTLTFGEKACPYLATRCLNELALRYGDSFPDAKPVILNDFYVDNLLTGFDSIESALIAQKQLIELLASAGFPLSKWCANDPLILKGINKDLLEKKFQLSFNDKEMIKTLGMLWVPTEDVFKIWFSRSDVATTCTRREILSVVASVFDPLGLIGPVTVIAKYFMQQIWQLVQDDTESINHTEFETDQSIDLQVLNDCVQSCVKTKAQRKLSKGKHELVPWDKPVPNLFLRAWHKYAANLSELNQVTIPRFIKAPFDGTHTELHGFADASARAYGAVIYCRTLNEKGEVTINLLCSKSRIAPLNEWSIARLELCAANLLAELMHKVYEILKANLSIARVRLWSDSKVTLSWIGSAPSKWNTFVAHRVSKIQAVSGMWQWDYVESNKNPADLLSRGVLPQNLVLNQLWFEGPDWLKTNCEPWTTVVTFLPNVKELNEKRKTQNMFSFKIVQQSSVFNLVSLPDTGKGSISTMHKNGLSKLLRLTAWTIRFKLHTQVYFPRAIGALKSYELWCAQITLYKLVQAECFPMELKCLKMRKPIEKTSRVWSLCPELDNYGIIRVGGRLQHSEHLTYAAQHPVLLPMKHRFTELVVWYEHLAHLHAGPRLWRSVLRRKYWIVQIDKAISRCLRKCHTCQRFRAKTYEEKMAPLPKSRVTPSKPFTSTGIDYAGPFQIIRMGGRQKSMLKAYIAVFVCFTTKAIHLELVSDLTTETFLAALRRFISRRGLPRDIHSDNGTTFVGAKNEIEKVKTFFKNNQEQLENFATLNGLQWHFIPPYAPHFGGIWEAGVKSVKAHLNKVLIGKILNFESFTTLLTQIEACLNSRPLTNETNHPDDLTALTPGHFLIGGPITSLPGESVIDIPDNRLKRWQQIQKLVQVFWQRWSSEYLNTLQQRYKWKVVKNEVKVNHLVVLKDDNMPPTKWRLGRIVQLHPDKKEGN